MQALKIALPGSYPADIHTGLLQVQQLLADELLVLRQAPGFGGQLRTALHAANSLLDGAGCRLLWLRHQ